MPDRKKAAYAKVMGPLEKEEKAEMENAENVWQLPAFKPVVANCYLMHIETRQPSRGHVSDYEIAAN